MTLVEFLAPLTKGSHADRVLAVLYFKTRYDNEESLTVKQIQDGMRAARVPRWRSVNVADVLNKCGAYVDSPGNEGKARLWKLTDTGKAHVRDLLSLPEADPEVENDVSTLIGLAAKIKNAEVKDYIEEAIKCLQIGALRACLVFVWSGAIRTIQESLINAGNLPNLNAAIKKHDAKARGVSRLDDFAYINDATILLAAKDLGLFDKGEHDTVKDALELRNKSGHPGKYNPGVKKVSSFIEDLIGIVFK